MTTLYELLGALPHDDAEGLRTAFRRAAKAAHPDINPDDPDASSRFRQIVRAHNILSDAEQREAYDQLLAIAQLEPAAQSKRTTIYETIQRLASNTIAATVISAVLIGSYTLFGPTSEGPAISRKAIEVAARAPIELAAITPTVQSDAIARIETRDARENTRTVDDLMTTGTVWPIDGAEPIANIDLAPDRSANDAKSYRRRGILAYRDGDLYRALADFDLAIQRDPSFAAAYVDRGIVLYRMRQFDRAFADMNKAKGIEGLSRTTATAPVPAPAPAPAPRKMSPVRVRDALNVAASDRFLDPGIQSDRALDLSMQSMPYERRR